MWAKRLPENWFRHFWQCISQSYPLHAPAIEEPIEEVDEVEDVGSEAIDEDNVPAIF